MRYDKAFFRIWLFRLLVAVAVFLMVWSFIMPWWTAGLSGIVSKATINIYAYGIPDKNIPAGVMNYIAGDITPLYQIVLAWIYLAASAILVMGSTWINGRMGQIMPGIIGIGFIAYAATAVYAVIASRTAEFDIPLQGIANIVSEGTTTKISTSFAAGYYWAYASGGACIFLALLRGVITGKSESGIKTTKNTMEAEQC
jgi:hypothetical protein